MNFMNKIKHIKIFAIALVALILSSCQDWLDVNSDPSFPQEAPAEVLLPPVFQEMARGDGLDSRVFGCYVQNYANTAAGYAFDVHGYIAGNDAGGEKWRQHYWSIGKNIDLIIDDATANQKWWYAGAAYAIRAWSWQTTTDVHGEMILKQAWEPNRYSFDYDSQEEVYAEVVRLCNLALEHFDMDDQSNSFVKGDLVYKGNVDSWRKFVYAILARNAHHLSNKSSYDANAVIAFVDKAMANNAENFNVPHAGGLANADGGNNNILGPTRANFTAFRQAQYSINLVNGTLDLVNGTATGSAVVDPRMSLMFQPSTDGVYRGGSNGSAINTAGATGIPLLYGKYIYRDNVAVPMMTYWEMQFIKAEAAFINNDLATAHAAYINGINAHMDYAGVSAANKNLYLASAAVAQTPAALKLNAIMLQKYISMFGHGTLETWVDMRRHRYSSAVYTGFAPPALLFATNNGRLAYRARPRHNSEYVWNVSALDKIGGLALDYNTVEPWFLLP
jgi:hypothetical protein